MLPWRIMQSGKVHAAGSAATDPPGSADAIHAQDATGLHSVPGGGRGPVPEEEKPSGWQRYARIIGLVVLIGVTIWGVREFAQGDWKTVTTFWRGKLPILPLVVGFAFLDMFLEGIAWTWVMERFGIRSRDFTGACVFMSSNAGRMLPAQLGRLIRPDAMLRLGRSTVAHSLKAEAAVFYLDAVSSATLLAGLIAWKIHPLLAPVAVAACIAVALRLGHIVADRLAGTKLNLPKDFWWNWRSAVTILIESCGWVAHGIGFYYLVHDLPGNMGMWDAMFFAPGSAVLGVGTGLPGGIGATEGLLGASLKFNQVPAEHLALPVAAFRVLTFWIWIPIGWLALVATRRKAANHANGS